jgi:hypothetical protein
MKFIIGTTITPFDFLANKMLDLEKKFKTVMVSNKKTYSIEDLCPYPFD